jgi:ribosomal protein S21
MTTREERNRKIADRCRRDMADAYMNQVGVEWDEACEDADRQWRRFLSRADGNVLVAEGMAFAEIARYANM